MKRVSLDSMAGLIVAGILFALVSPGHADDATNATAGQHTNGISITLTAGHDHSPSDDYFGLPKEAFDRLTPDQITQLAQSHKDQNGDVSAAIMVALIPVVMFTFIGISVWLGVNGKLKRNRQLHETLRLMIEKGQPIPPELLQSQDSPRRPRSDLRTGLVLIAVGIGVFFLPLGNVSSRAGLIPLLMGVAFLIVWKIESNKNGQNK